MCKVERDGEVNESDRDGEVGRRYDRNVGILHEWTLD